MKWFKFYGQDWLTDLKIRKMKIEDRLCFITLLCLASSSDGNGVVKNCDEDSLIEMTGLHNDPLDDDNEFSRARGCLKRYEALQIVTLADNGDVTLVNFDRRQGENLSNAERQKNYRERLKTTTKKSNARNVTQRNDSNARIDKKRIEKNIHTAEADAGVVNEFLELFREVNPSVNSLFPRKAERDAVRRLLKDHGDEKLRSIIAYLPKSNASPYAPTIITPTGLERDLGKLIAWSQKQKSKIAEKEVIVAFS